MMTQVSQPIAPVLAGEWPDVRLIFGRDDQSSFAELKDVVRPSRRRMVDRGHSNGRQLLSGDAASRPHVR